MRKTVSRVAVSLLFTAAFGWSQTSTGTIIGTVADGTGAVIATAKIAVVNTGTNAKLEVLSNEEGSYTAPLLPPGAYSVMVTAQGFKSFERSGIQLRVPAAGEGRHRSAGRRCDGIGFGERGRRRRRGHHVIDRQGSG